MSQDIYKGHWSSGEKASGAGAFVSFEADGLSVKDGEGAILAFWRYRDLLPGAPVARNANDALLRNSQAPRASLFLEGEGIGTLLVKRAPQTAQSFQRFKIVSLSLIATAIAVMAGVALFMGRVSASKAVAGMIPGAMADRIGLQSIAMFGPIAPECVNQPGNAALQRLLDRLESSGSYGRPFKLHVAKSAIPNAFALPGGHIVLLSALVKQAKSPEEAAGVIAHEMGHELERDPEALFVRNLGMQALIAFLTGQSGSQSPLTAGALLLQLRYSRAAEHSADAHALEILRNARIDPKAAGDFFLRHADGAGQDSVLSYLSTHPSSKERAQLFLSQPPYPVQPALTEKEWADVQALCGTGPIQKKPGEEKTKDNPSSRKA